METPMKTQHIVAAKDGMRVGDVVPAGTPTYREAGVGAGVERTGDGLPADCFVRQITTAGRGCAFRVALVVPRKTEL